MLIIARIDMKNALQIRLTCKFCEEVIRRDDSPKSVAVTHQAALMS